MAQFVHKRFKMAANMAKGKNMVVNWLNFYKIHYRFTKHSSPR